VTDPGRSVAPSRQEPFIILIVKPADRESSGLKPVTNSSVAAGRLRRRNRKTMSEPQGNVSAVEVDIYTELRTAERWWTEFERRAECTVFQRFAWLAAWHNHIGRHQGTTPVIVRGRDPNSESTDRR
jgi:CelD/BcsL family acetyltransferase involved in cellulose biosynthesis